MKLSKPTLYLFLFLFSLSQPLLSQEVIRDYFRSPVKPGGRNYLSGNFSELRPNHFHTGLDYKFGGVEGEPIYAAADGWIHRIKISSFGYGNVIYIKHPTGHITLYGHLRNFNPKLQKYMVEKMYEAKANELEYYPEPGEIPIKKGERIADGGNTGNSGGPHLHFEIRDSLDRAMDPLLFGFPEILDRTPPTPQIVAIVPLEVDSRVNGKFQRLEITPQAVGNNYRLPSTIKISGKVGLEFRGFDQLDGASNRNGFPYFELREADSLVLFNLKVDKVDFNYTRQFLLHTHQNRFTKLYHQENLKFEYLHPNLPETGYLELEAGTKKEYTLELSDAYGNRRRILFSLEGEELNHQVADGPAPTRAQVEYIGKILKIKAPNSHLGGLARFYVGANSYEMLPAYQDAQSRTYLWDMRFGIPEEVDICSELVNPKVNAFIPVGWDQLYAEKGVQIRFEESTLLDPLYLRVEETGSSSNPRLNLNDPNEYLFSSMEVLWDVSGYTGNRQKTHVYQLGNRERKSFVGGIWEDGSIRFKTRNFGTFVLAEDAVKPTVTPVRINSSEIRFTIRDNLSGIQSFEAMIDGKWVLMRYEHKRALIWSEKLDEQPFKGPVILKVTDLAGNVTEWKGTIG
ncbi:M23 family metallopeptidase [Algoriphagus sp. CAU 1675]|uniref:M23 family metallopeptidase n=1 Tax=Algoriphagus sp. CAU 1675 TaxID=3032597 RepID=UPI0023DBD95D|nr:M23 family metallopeptidase [Algoriphagus sp. CAU 1675]MDF2159349.1 M23 family metallopeptidase [Algoriphagus sp. CAU 1675]